jgi:PST family polysaccharide transporter
MARALRPGRTLFGSSLVRNAFGLYVLQIGAYALPVVTTVLLAHRLGVRSWGQLAFMQAFGTYVTLAVNYGFGYSATREAARHRKDPEVLSELFAGVMGAKVALSVLSLVLALLASALLTPVQSNGRLLWPAMVWALSLSFSPSWYFQGIEQMGFVARWETFARVLSLAGILLLVRVPADTWKVLVIQGLLFGAAVGFETWVAWRQVGFKIPSVRLVWHTLRLGWSMFLFLGALSLYTVGNGFILGLFAGSTAVGYYAGAERISKAVASLLFPITQAVFPRISHLASGARAEAARLARLNIVVVGGAGCVMGILLFLMAPVLVQTLLGPEFDKAIVVLRILAFLPPLIAVSNVLGIQWMLALGLDRYVNGVVLLAGVLNLSLAFALVPRHAQVGMAVAVVLSEALVALGLYAVLRLKHLDPLMSAAPEDVELTVPA